MPLLKLDRLREGLEKGDWAGFLRDCDRALRAGNHPETTRYNYLLAAAQLAKYLAAESPDPDADDAGQDPTLVTKAHIESFQAWMIETRSASTAFLDYVLQRLPFPVEVIQTDNGAEFQTEFHWHVLDKGIAHTYIKPASPHLNGKVQRSHRIDAEEFYRMLEGVVIDDTGVFNDKLAEWEDYYNYHRPHGALDGQTPYERLKQKTQTQV